RTRWWPAPASLRGSELVPGAMHKQAAARSVEVVALPPELPVLHHRVGEGHHEVEVLPADRECIRRLIVVRVLEVHILRDPTRKQGTCPLGTEVPERHVSEMHAPVGDEAAA